MGCAVIGYEGPEGVYRADGPCPIVGFGAKAWSNEDASSSHVFSEFKFRHEYFGVFHSFDADEDFLVLRRKL